MVKISNHHRTDYYCSYSCKLNVLLNCGKQNAKNEEGCTLMNYTYLPLICNTAGEYSSGFKVYNQVNIANLLLIHAK